MSFNRVLVVPVAMFLTLSLRKRCSPVKVLHRAGRQLDVASGASRRPDALVVRRPVRPQLERVRPGAEPDRERHLGAAARAVGVGDRPGRQPQAEGGTGVRSRRPGRRTGARRTGPR